MALIPNNSAQKVRVQNAGSEWSTNPTLKTKFLSNMGLTGGAAAGLTVASGKAAVISNSLTLAGTDATTMTFPSTSATVARTDAANTFTGTQTVGATSQSDNQTFTAIGKGAILKQGANGRVGTFVLNGATPVTVSNTSVAITDAIVISLNTVGGTVGVQPHVATITAATGFTVVGTASDTSTMNYALIKNAA